MAMMGFTPAPVLAEVREFKLLRATEARNACTYCSVSCGILLYSLGDPYRNANDPSSEELAREYSGKALSDLARPDEGRAPRRTGGLPLLRIFPGSQHRAYGR
jgi:anaerobic selenocysteine-containing dehydrogenase